MKKLSAVVLASLALVFMFTCSAYAGSGLKSAALRKLQTAVLKALPADSRISRLAVLDFEGDDGTVRDSITSAITEKSSFKVIERADLDKILKEQGLQLKDIMEEKTRIEHGKLKGVQGLLIGRVVSLKEGFMSYTLKAGLKLDDVEKGEIVFSRDFDISVVSPLRQYLLYGAFGFAVLVMLAALRKKRRAAVIRTVISKAVRARVDLVKELGKALSFISGAKARLMDKGRSNDAALLKKTETDLMLLRQYVETAASGSGTINSRSAFRQTLESDKGIISFFEGIVQSAEKVYNVTFAGGPGLEQEADFLGRNIRETINEFKNRGFV